MVGLFLYVIVGKGDTLACEKHAIQYCNYNNNIWSYSSVNLWFCMWGMHCVGEASRGRCPGSPGCAQGR